MSTFTLTTKIAYTGFVRSLKAKLWRFLAWVRPTTGGCLKGVWRVSGRSLKRVWKVSGRCLESPDWTALAQFAVEGIE